MPTVNDIQFQVLVGVRAVHEPSSSLSPKFLAVGLNTIVLSDDGIGGLSLNGAKLSSLSLGNGKMFLGSAGGVATEVTPSGDFTMSNTGVAALANGSVDTPELVDAAVTAPKLSVGLQNEFVDHETRITTLEIDTLALQNAVTAIQNNNPARQIITSTAAQTDFTLTTLAVDPLNTVFDLDVTIDGRLQTQDTAAGATESYFKVSSTVIRLSEALPAGKKVVFFKRGTANGTAIAPGPGSNDLTTIAVNVSPAVAGAVSVGTATKPFSYLFLKDSATSQVYQFIITNGTFAIEPV